MMLAFFAILSVVGIAVYATYLITKRRTTDRITTAYCDERDDLDERAAQQARVHVDLCDFRDGLLDLQARLEARERAQSPRTRFEYQPAIAAPAVDWTAVEESLGRGMFEAELPCYRATTEALPGTGEYALVGTYPDDDGMVPQPGPSPHTATSPNTPGDGQTNPGGGNPPKPRRVLRKHKRAMAKAAGR